MSVGLIEWLWRQQPGEFFCVSTKSRLGRWRDEFFTSDELSEVAGYVRGQRERCDVYFAPNGFAKAGRRIQYVCRGFFLFADLDEANPRRIEYRPTIALASSPGRYVGLWRVDRTITDTLNKRMSYAVGADRGGWDATQVLRFPGTYNYKPAYNMPRIRVLWDDGPEYRVQDLELSLSDVAPVVATSALEIDPTGDWRAVCRRLNVRACRVKGDSDPDRSRAIFRLAARLIKAGASPNDLACVLLEQPQYRSKRGTDIDALRSEVSRLWAKLAGKA
jgi:hypothetical protein